MERKEPTEEKEENQVEREAGRQHHGLPSARWGQDAEGSTDLVKKTLSVALVALASAVSVEWQRRN